MNHRLPAGFLMTLLLACALAGCRQPQPDPSAPPPDPQTTSPG